MLYIQKIRFIIYKWDNLRLHAYFWKNRNKKNIYIYKCIYMYIYLQEIENFIKNIYVNYLINIRIFMYIKILKNYMM